MEKKTKILICGILPPPFFGHSMIYKILMESEFVRKYEVTFLNMRFWSYQQHKKITFKKIAQLVQYYFHFIFIILVKRPKYVLYAISFDKMPFLKDVLFCMTGRFLGRKIVLHDMGQYIKELYDSSDKTYRWFIRWLLGHVTASIVLGENTKLFYRGFIEPRRLFSVPGSVEDVPEITQEPDGDCPSSAAVKVLYLSFLSKSKGIMTALEAIPFVLARNNKINFIFAGPVESEEIQCAMQEMCERFNDNVVYVGYVDDEKRAACYRNADIFIFPTLRDVFGLVLLHAMSYGLAIVASREGAIPEIINDAENGLLIPKGDSRQLAEEILLLAGDPALRRKMGQANRRKYLNMYTPQKYGERMIEAFEMIEEFR